MSFNSIYLIFHGRFPSEKAHALFAAKGAEAFASLGHEVVLLVPRRLRRAKKDPYEHYKTKRNYKIVYLPTIDFFSIPFLKCVAFRVSLLIFSLSTFIYLILNVRRNELIYSNETLPLLISSLFYPNTIYELHDFPEKNSWFYSLLFKRVKKILVTNKWKLEKACQQFPIVQNKIFLEMNAVDIDEFNIPVSKEEARAQLHLPLNIKIVLYTGHLYTWKGVEILAEAAKKLSEDYLVYFVGGLEKDVIRFRKKYGAIKNIRFIGYRPHHEIPLWQKAADVLVLPNTAKQDISKFYTSPMKLFEYMASGTPIVASRIPSIEEIVSNSEVFLVEPDNETLLARGIVDCVTSSVESEIASNMAQKRVSEHTWNKRAQRILKVITNI